MTDEIRTVLGRALPETEPTALTVDLLVAAGRRRLARRRLGYLGGGAGAAAVLAATALLAPRVLDEARPADPDPPVATTPESPYPPAPSTLEELSDLIRELFEAQAPNLEMRGEDGREPLDLAERGRVESSEPGVEYEIALSGEAFLTTPDGEPAGSVAIRLYEPGPWTDQPATTEEEHFLVGNPLGGPLISCWSGSTAMSSDDPAVTRRMTETICDESATADGDRLVTSRTEEHDSGHPVDMAWNQAVVFRSDGTAVQAEHVCGSADEDEESGQCHQLRITPEQLAEILVQVPAVPVDGS